jgi:hypothetical protein
VPVVRSEVAGQARAALLHGLRPDVLRCEQPAGLRRAAR